MSKNLNLTHAHLRRDYASDGLLEKQMKATPMQQFKIWFQNAVEARVSDANAFVLATVDSQTRPAARVLLMKGLILRGLLFLPITEAPKERKSKNILLGRLCFFGPALTVRCDCRVLLKSCREMYRPLIFAPGRFWHKSRPQHRIKAGP